MNLSEFDLNLLIVFDAIYREKSLTKAGQRLHLSQSAISHSLNRLRSAFNDPLFVRHGYSMDPTMLTEEVIPNVQKILYLAETTLEDQGSFNPQKSTRTFNIGLQDYPMLVLLPKLMEEIGPLAPDITIRIFHLNMESRYVALEDGKVELIIGSRQSFGTNIYHEFLFKDREVCIMRKDHPHIGETLSLAEYVNSEFIRLAISDFEEEVLDSRLKELGHKRKFRLIVEQEVTIPRLVCNTDYLANISERVASEYIPWLPIKILPIPLSPNDFEIYQYWHLRYQLDPAHNWLRNKIKMVCGKIQ